MDLHRALVRNNGFFKVLVPKKEGEKDDEEIDELSASMAKAQLEDGDEPRAARSLPVPAPLSKVYLDSALVTAANNIFFIVLPSLCFNLR